MIKTSIVIGAGFGDEGKGRTVSYLVSQSKKPLVIRFNGGQQAGHTVDFFGLRHVFSSFGSGTLQGAPTYISEDCVIYPKTLVKEYQHLKNLNITPTISIASETPITTIYDVLANRENPNNLQHGTCGLGVGMTMKRENANYHLTFGDLFNKTVFNAKLDCIKKDYYNYKDSPQLKNEEDKFKEAVEFMRTNYIGAEEFYFEDIHSNYDHIIFEGAQGLLLDQTFGFFPNVTYSSTGSQVAIEILDSCGLFLNEVELIYVSRIYQTRHGNGFMSDERPLVLVNNEKETNVNNTFQGNFRKGLLDLDLMEYAINSDLKTINNGMLSKLSLMLTCLDQMKDIHAIREGIVHEMETEDIHEAFNDFIFDGIYHSFGACTDAVQVIR